MTNQRLLILAFINALLLCYSFTDAFIHSSVNNGLHRRACMHATKTVTPTTTTRSTKSSSSSPTAVGGSALPTPEESAKALTDYMVKAHEEKIRAMQEVEAKYKTQMEELQQRIKELEGTTPVPSSDGKAFELPATNKQMTQKVEAYQTFLSEYIVNVQQEKVKAVKAAENVMKAKYEAILKKIKDGTISPKDL